MASAQQADAKRVKAMTFCYLIGIAGGSASGKSTLAKALGEAYSHRTVTVLAMDSYYKPEEELPLVTLENGKQYRDYNCPDSFDLPRLRADIDRIMTEKSCRILIVEGLLTLWDEWINDVCDVRVFVDCPDDVRVIRRIKRNLTWGLTLDEITDVYLDLVRHRHKEFVAPSVKNADIVIQSEDGVETGVWQIRKLLRGLYL